MAKDPTDYVYLNEVPKQAIPGKTKKIGMFDPEELTLIRDKGHYLYDPRVELDFDENMVKGIMELGLSKSVDAQKIRQDDGTCILAVTDGRQGVINTLEANRRLIEEGRPPIKIKVEVREEEEVTSMRRMVVNNEHRRSDDPVTKGWKARKIKDRGVPIELICQDFRCVPETLNNWLKLTELCAHVQKLVQTDQLAMTAALKLRGMSPAEQKEKADEIVAGTKRSKRGVGRAHVGVDRRRIKRLYELSSAKTDVSKRILSWLVGDTDDESVSDLIDFSVLKRDDGNGDSEGKKPKKAGRRKRDEDDSGNDVLNSLFGGDDGTVDEAMDIGDLDLDGLEDDDGLEVDD